MILEEPSMVAAIVNIIVLISHSEFSMYHTSIVRFHSIFMFGFS